MGKGTNFSGQQIFTQLLNLLDKSKISKASKALGATPFVRPYWVFYRMLNVSCILALIMLFDVALFQRPTPGAHLRSLPWPITIPTDVIPVV